MVYDLQKASMWKRIAAWMFDGILIATLAVGFGLLLSLLLGYDTHNETMETSFAAYEAESHRKNILRYRNRTGRIMMLPMPHWWRIRIFFTHTICH